MKRVAFPLVLACFLPALWLSAIGAETNHNFARWEKEISAYERMDRTNPPPQDGMVFIGSSTIRLWRTLARDFPGQPVINRGFGGSDILDSAYFANRIVIPYKPKMVFLRAGSNDIIAGKTPEQVFEDFQSFVEKVRSALPETEVVYISLCPSVRRWRQADKEKALNQMVKDYVGQKPHLKYLECYDMSLGPDGLPRPDLFVGDKLHFNAAGYKLLAERVRPYLAAPAK